MVKTKKQAKNRPRNRRGVNRPGGFGAVSLINTAPVSVGNSVRGSRPRVSQTTDGARVVGRDFAFALSGTVAAITNWELIGGMPITPCVLPSSILRNYCQMFQKFQVNSFAIHYITSSPTSQAGDVLFYYEKDRFAPMVDYTNSSFLPYVLSDPGTMIGPQWTNHTASFKPSKEWKTTLFGSETDLNEDAEGTIFLFSKTNAANSPGYLLIDYDFSFKELSVNPRAGALPVARGQSSFVNFRNNGLPVAGVQASWITTAGNTIAGAVSTIPNGAITGDVYKCILQVTSSQLANAAWTGTSTPTTANMLQFGDDKAILFDDGFTVFVTYNHTGSWNWYTTLENAVTGARSIEWQTTQAAFAVNITAELQLVRNYDELTQSAY
jgi:hypothetical protein